MTATALEELALPPELSSALERLAAELTAAAGENLKSLVLYGGLARGRYRPGRSDVNVAVVLADAGASELEKLAPALRAAWRSVRADPFIILAAEIPRVLDVFPTKLLDIQSRHVLLAGADLFQGLEVRPEDVRRRAEQELRKVVQRQDRNLSMRMRRTYVSIHDDPAALARSLAEVARPLALQLATLLDLSGRELPAEDRSAAIFAASAEPFGLDARVLARVAELRQQPAAQDGMASLYAQAMEQVARAAEVADRMETR